MATCRMKLHLTGACDHVLREDLYVYCHAMSCMEKMMLRPLNLHGPDFQVPL